MFHDRVRDGNGWVHRAVAPGISLCLQAPSPCPMDRGAALVGRPRLRAEDRVNGVLVSEHGTELNFAEQDSIFTPSADWDRSAAPVTGRAPAAHATWWSTRGLTPSRGMGRLILGCVSRLDAVSASHVRAWLPGDAPGGTTRTPAARPPRSSRTGGSSPHTSTRPRRIETELSHDVLNPARVPL